MNKQRMADAVKHISEYMTDNQVTYKESYYILEAIKSKIEADMHAFLRSTDDNKDNNGNDC